MSRLRAAPVFYMSDGNSIATFPNAADCYPTQLLASTGWTGLNKAVPSTPWGQLDDTFPVRCAPYMKAGLVPVYGMVGGIADVQLGASAAVIYTRVKAMATLARAAGGASTLVIASTITPYDLLSAPLETVRLDANTLLLADADVAFDAVVDLCAAPMDDPTNTTYYSDGLHPTTVGAGLIATRMAAAVTPLLPA